MRERMVNAISSVPVRTSEALLALTLLEQAHGRKVARLRKRARAQLQRCISWLEYTHGSGPVPIALEVRTNG